MWAHRDARADKLAARFGVPWATLRDRVLHSDDPARRLSATGKTAARRRLSPAAAASAIARVAQANDTQRISSAEYERGAARLNENAKRKHTHGTHLIPLPTAGTIQEAHRFGEATRQAGLEFVTTNSQAVLARSEAVIAFIEHYGFLPRQADLEWMGRHHGIQLVKRKKDPLTAATEAARARFAAQGRWFPPVASVNARPAEWQHLADDAVELRALARAYPRKRTNREAYTLDDIRDAIARAFDHDTTGKRLSVNKYRVIARELGLPSFTTVDRIAQDHDTNFPLIVREEAQRRAANRAPPNDPS